MHTVVASHLTLTAVLFGVVMPDLLLTCPVAVLERQPRLLLLAAFFPFMRMLDAAIGLYAIPQRGWPAPTAAGRARPGARPGGSAAAALRPTRARRGGASLPGWLSTGTSNEPGCPAQVAEASHVSG